MPCIHYFYFQWWDIDGAVPCSHRGRMPSSIWGWLAQGGCCGLFLRPSSTRLRLQSWWRTLLPWTMRNIIFSHTRWSTVLWSEKYTMKCIKKIELLFSPAPPFLSCWRLKLIHLKDSAQLRTSSFISWTPMTTLLNSPQITILPEFQKTHPAAPMWCQSRWARLHPVQKYMPALMYVTQTRGEMLIFRQNAPLIP